ncbi:hypothetical protein PINS_up009203 [Pythium insidiosum]|nr:hypothetical protein PINS_up009203 [Pythium insidiosum]
MTPPRKCSPASPEDRSEKPVQDGEHSSPSPSAAHHEALGHVPRTGVDCVPINVIDCASVQKAFTALEEPALSTFDPTNKLKRVRLFAGSVTSRVTVKDQCGDEEAAVARLVDMYLPQLESFSTERSLLILREQRERVDAYLSAQRRHLHDVIDKAASRPWSRVHERRTPIHDDQATSSMLRTPTFVSCCGEAHARECQIGRGALVVQLPREPTLPNSIACVPVQTMARVHDDPIVRFLPNALTDTIQPVASRESTSSTEAPESQARQAVRSRSALSDDVSEWLLRVVVCQLGDTAAVFDALTSVAGFAHPQTDFIALQQRERTRRKTGRRLADVRALIASTTMQADSRAYQQLQSLLQNQAWTKPVDQRSLSQRLAPDPPCFDSQLVRAHLGVHADEKNASRRLGIRPVDSYAALTSSYRTLLCRQCFVYGCSRHDMQRHPLPARRVDPVFPRSVSRRMLRLELDAGAGADIEEDTHAKSRQPCGETCWRQRCLPMRQQLPCSDPAQQLILAKLARVVGPDADACTLARTVRSISCRAMRAFLSSHYVHPIDDDDNDDGGDDDDDEDAEDAWEPNDVAAMTMDATSRGVGVDAAGTHRDVMQRTVTQRLAERSVRREIVPCEHIGVCDSLQCSCVRRDHFCDKACACAADCPNRFQGCQCERGQCRSSDCVCVAAQRECDPDVCRSCGSIGAVIGAFNRGCWVSRSNAAGAATDRRALSSSSRTGCGNVGLQTMSRRLIRIGRSPVHGWGVYVVERISRGELVCEYVGELISQDEAERRGSVYDRKATSYLFDLNEDAVVDAFRVGNKARFINHAPSHEANCEGKVVLIRGDHRIGIWAKRDIRRGEELFFDYGYHTSTAPDWSRAQAS